MAAPALTATINSVWMGIAVVALAWCAVRILPRLNAATRYWIWYAALLLTAALPVLLSLRVDPPRTAPAAAIDLPREVSREAAPDTGQDAFGIASETAEPAPAKSPAPFEIPLPATLPALVVLAWGTIVLLGVARLAREFIVQSRFRRRCSPASDSLESHLNRWIHRTRTRRRITLMLSEDDRGPLAIGFIKPAIVIPAALIAELSDPELDKIVLHELAHLRRRDDWTRLLQRVIETLLFFHPAVIWLGRKLDLEREVACDDWVIVTTGQAHEYASCLTRIVELARFRRRFALAAGAADTRSHLIRRIELMLDKTRNYGTRASWLALLGLAAAVVLVALVAGHLPSAFAVTASPAWAGDNDGSSRWHTTWNENGRRLEISVDGAVEFTNDDRGIKTLSPGGLFWIESNAGGETKRYEVRADSGGNLTRTFLVDGRSRNSGEAKPWLAGKLPEVIRETGIGAGPRIQRIAEHGGATAAIREIGLIHSDGSKRLYIEQLIERVRMDDSQLGETMRLVRSISSDGEKTRAIVTVSRKYRTLGLREGMFDAIDTIHSDGERHRALTAVVEGDPNKDTVLLASRSAGRISSDGEKAAILVQMAGQASTDETRRSWLKTATSINSDGGKRRAISAMLNADGRPATLAPLLHAASGISSDGEKANLLIQAASLYTDTDAVRREFFDAADTIHSDGEHARVLHAVLERNTSAATLTSAAKSARRISSDGEKSRVLQRIAKENLTDPAVRTAFFEAADSINSDGEHARVLSVAAGRSGLPDDIVVAIVRSAARIRSDGEKARVLAQIAQRYGRNAAVSQELRSALRTISSDGEYRRVMSVLDSQSPAI